MQVLLVGGLSPFTASFGEQKLLLFLQHVCHCPPFAAELMGCFRDRLCPPQRHGDVLLLPLRSRVIRLPHGNLRPEWNRSLCAAGGGGPPAFPSVCLPSGLSPTRENQHTCVSVPVRVCMHTCVQTLEAHLVLCSHCSLHPDTWSTPLQLTPHGDAPPQLPEPCDLTRANGGGLIFCGCFSDHWLQHLLGPRNPYSPFEVRCACTSSGHLCDAGSLGDKCDRRGCCPPPSSPT